MCSGTNATFLPQEAGINTLAIQDSAVLFRRLQPTRGLSRAQKKLSFGQSTKLAYEHGATSRINRIWIIVPEILTAIPVSLGCSVDPIKTLKIESKPLVYMLK